MLLSSTRKDWLGNVRGDVLAGIVVALALIPEAIAFSIIAGVDPQVGLYSAFCIPLVMAFFHTDRGIPADSRLPEARWIDAFCFTLSGHGIR